MKRYPRAVLTGAVLVALVTGCVSEDGESLALPEKNIDRWVMPLDPYAVGNATVTDYAQALLLKPCMEEAGFAYDVPWIDIDAAPPATRSETFRRLFDEAIASEWGYHQAPSNQPNAAQMGELNSTELSSDAEARLIACLDGVREIVSAPDGVDQLSTSLASAAWDATMADSAVLSAAEAWRECMAPQGISDLPELPLDMPSPSLATQFGLDGDGVTAAPSAEEIAIAVADAQCQLSSGFRELLYDTEWEKEAAALQENADALVRARQSNDERRAAALQVINEAGAS